MPGTVAIIRDLVYDAINQRKVVSFYPFNAFSVSKAYLPDISLEALKLLPEGKLYVIGLPFDVHKISRSNTGEMEIGVHLGYQRGGVDVDNIPAIDDLVYFIELLNDTCRKYVDQNSEIFSFMRNECMKDENGTPFAYRLMHESRTFEAYFTAYYSCAVA